MKFRPLHDRVLIEVLRFEFFAIRDAINGDMEKMKYIKH